MEQGANPFDMGVLERFELAPQQHLAAAMRGKDIVVTAGAGSGKTRTLVARYVALLAEGYSPRRVVAITFTEKAAREMRSRVRSALTEQIARANATANAAEANAAAAIAATIPLEARRRWIELDAQMDAARIGTIHSLCAEILRAHPAEAEVDPRFEVLDEGLAATLRLQAVKDTLSWLVGVPEFTPLLTGMKPGTLESLLSFLLDRRLETQAAFNQELETRKIFLQALHTITTRPVFTNPLAELRALQASGHLLDDAGDRLAEQVEALLNCWSQAEQALANGDWLTAADNLFTARQRWMGGSTGKKDSTAKTCLAELKNAYDAFLDPWLGGQKTTDTLPDATLEDLFEQTQALLSKVFEHLLQVYQGSLRQRQALDFDDLEAGAVRLLAQPGIRQQWQAEIDALLVDEFQDTNARQREIILALSGDTPGRLFVVGDARQSIYRFRQADVVVFRRLQQDIHSRGGLVIDLDVTYRAHKMLLQAVGDLLVEVMGVETDPEKPYEVPYTALTPNHEISRSGINAPYVEFVLGAGTDAESARPVAAQALAQRLLELHQAGEIQRWDDVALLFRASTGFPAYETAFENAGIPFVTVAGQGFYDRPEIRDVLNLLRALVDPWDDLALAGLLRSPAFGLSDAALFRLRWQAGQAPTPGSGQALSEQPIPYWNALHGTLECLPEPEQSHCRRALELLKEFQPLVDRLPVAELLKRLVDRLDYRAILASSDLQTGRLWRNLDKLLADAQASGLVNVRAFLEYLDTLHEVGAREGEAPAEAEGAVRLMTIHKAKGLEFPLVVLADAARLHRTTSEIAYLLAETGLAFKFDLLDTPPLLYRLARFHDSQQTAAEEKRLLYVALTRAKEKLLISGHCTNSRSGRWKAEGWLDKLIHSAKINLDAVIASGLPDKGFTTNGQPVRVWALSAESAGELPIQPKVELRSADSLATPLYHPVPLPIPETLDPEPGEILRSWRATGVHLRPPAEALGHLVHRAIQCWKFPASESYPGDPEVTRILEIAALEAGLVDPAQRTEALHLAEILLRRFQRHPVWQEINQAQARYHEIPYTHFQPNHHLDTGYIDLLYRREAAQAWQILDFKTDSLHDTNERQAAIERYREQMQRYCQAILDLLHAPVQARLCFLDDAGKVSLVDM